MRFINGPPEDRGRIWRRGSVKKINLGEQAEEIESIFHKAVQHELSIHKRLGNPIAAWRNGKVVIIPPDQIQVDESLADRTVLPGLSS